MRSSLPGTAHSYTHRGSSDCGEEAHGHIRKFVVIAQSYMATMSAIRRVSMVVDTYIVKLALHGHQMVPGELIAPKSTRNVQ